MLYFKPAANRISSTAKMINPNSEVAWVKKLKSLKVGEFVASGNFIINGRHVDSPIVITANVDEIKDFPEEAKYSCSNDDSHLIDDNE